MNINWQIQSVGDIVARLPKAAELFKAKRIDFCCGGHRLLGDVLREQNQDEKEIFERLDVISATQRKEAENFMAMDPHDLADYIEGRHHTYMRQALPTISAVFFKVLKAHGANHPDLFKLHGLFGNLRTELEQHLVKEEALLFPVVDGEDEEEAARLAGEIIAEHEAAGAVLKQLRHITNDYTAPADGCATYDRLMEQLEELEGDLFQHIHLENNILLKGYRAKGDGTDA